MSELPTRRALIGGALGIAALPVVTGSGCLGTAGPGPLRGLP